MGEAKFTGCKALDVRLNDGGTRTLTGERIFLNLGTHASIPPVPGLAESEPLTNIEMGFIWAIGVQVERNSKALA